METGTQRGEMVNAVLNTFIQITSIEINPDHYRESKRRFSGVKKVELLHGDSGVLLPEVLNEIKESTLFWLDAHGYCPSEGVERNPVLTEVESILAHHIAGHIVLIDDARCFGWEKYYPSIDELRRVVGKFDVSMEIADDCIRIAPDL